MINTAQEILTVNSLKIGYSSGKGSGSILPPLTASACVGELVAVIGRNGIGKSTLLRTITGLQSSLGGSVLINSEDAASFSRLQLAQKVGYISTEIVKVNHMRVCELVALGRFPYTNWIGRIDQVAQAIIKQAIQSAGLAGFENRFVSELSDGERQRAMIARVLAQDTEIVIMDEPTAFLDITGKYGIISLMKELTSGGKTIIFSTHDFNIAINQADKIWLMDEFQLIQGAPEDLLLANAFDRLFDPSLVRFNPNNGTFNFRSRKHGNIFIEGHDGNIRHWTARALSRAGFIVTDEKTDPYIKLPSADNAWELITEDNLQSFKTLYDLVSRLLKNKV